MRPRALVLFYRPYILARGRDLTATEAPKLPCIVLLCTRSHTYVRYVYKARYVDHHITYYRYTHHYAAHHTPTPKLAQKKRVFFPKIPKRKGDWMYNSSFLCSFQCSTVYHIPYYGERKALFSVKLQMCLFPLF